nr:MFS transporter [Sphingomonas kyeonggiensis]
MTSKQPARPTGGWSAVLALSLCVATLIASEFMPMSLLTPLASDLRVTEGQAGQAIAVSGVFAVATSLFIAAATRGLDRRLLLMGLTGTMLGSGLIVAFAPNYPVFMIGRALIGVVIGGFWSMSAASVMRLVPERDVPRALALLNGGNALATTIAAPLGSFLGQFIGWRGAFFCVVPLAVITLAWQYLTLPSMPSRQSADSLATVRLLAQRRVTLGMVALAAFFGAQFTLFTYLRPFLETATGVGVNTISAILLAMGVAGLAGTYAIGRLVVHRLHPILVAMPVVMAALGMGIIAFGSSAGVVAILLAVWGFVGTAAPVAWWTWLSRILPDDAEAGGGLLVAVVQLALTAGAAIGGLLFDWVGYEVTFGLSVALFALSAIFALLTVRARKASRDAIGASHPQRA